MTINEFMELRPYDFVVAIKNLIKKKQEHPMEESAELLEQNRIEKESICYES